MVSVLHLLANILIYFNLFTGNDEFGKILSTKATEAGVKVNYLIDGETPTGTCAVCITGKHRYKILQIMKNLKTNCCKFVLSNTCKPPVSDHPKCQDLVVIYGRWLFTRVEPKGVFSMNRLTHLLIQR